MAEITFLHEDRADMIIEINLIRNGRLLIAAGGKNGDGKDHQECKPGGFSGKALHAIVNELEYRISEPDRKMNIPIFRDITMKIGAGGSWPDELEKLMIYSFVVSYDLTGFP
jgi:hypothetical protein